MSLLSPQVPDTGNLQCLCVQIRQLRGYQEHLCSKFLPLRSPIRHKTKTKGETTGFSLEILCSRTLQLLPTRTTSCSKMMLARDRARKFHLISSLSKVLTEYLIQIRITRVLVAVVALWIWCRRSLSQDQIWQRQNSSSQNHSPTWEVDLSLKSDHLTLRTLCPASSRLPSKVLATSGAPLLPSLAKAFAFQTREVRHSSTSPVRTRPLRLWKHTVKITDKTTTTIERWLSLSQRRCKSTLTDLGPSQSRQFAFQIYNKVKK